MKKLRSLGIIAFLTFAARSLLAETDVGRQLNQLKAQQEKAVVAAVEPLKRRYQTSLEQLLTRAMQSNDLDTAIKIREELTALGVQTPAAPGAKVRYTRETLPHFLSTSEWSWSAKPEPGGSTHVTFTRDGQFVMLGKVMGAYKVIDGNSVQVDNRMFKFASDYKSFEVAAWTDGTPRYGYRVD